MVKAVRCSREATRAFAVLLLFEMLKQARIAVLFRQEAAASCLQARSSPRITLREESALHMYS